MLGNLFSLELSTLPSDGHFLGLAQANNTNADVEEGPNPTLQVYDLNRVESKKEACM